MILYFPLSGTVRDQVIFPKKFYLLEVDETKESPDLGIMKSIADEFAGIFQQKMDLVPTYQFLVDHEMENCTIGSIAKLDAYSILLSAELQISSPTRCY